MKKTSVDFTFLYKKYPGQWVALANDEKTVLAAGKTAKEVLETTGTNKKNSPILYKVPSKIAFSINLSTN